MKTSTKHKGLSHTSATRVQILNADGGRSELSRSHGLCSLLEVARRSPKTRAVALVLRQRLCGTCTRTEAPLTGTLKRTVLFVFALVNSLVKNFVQPCGRHDTVDENG